ncbi:hypothetical protein NPIL_386861 [Nephila pilipes]|uniref:Uncharacterized protein n=1 Tax=Nephila pilipes TaxID=299642 RepID=A0A8X6U619_NEPPI|nr:hypothetical protein NPIL_386861 [Nephila pilipes]
MPSSSITRHTVEWHTPMSAAITRVFVEGATPILSNAFLQYPAFPSVFYQHQGRALNIGTKCNEMDVFFEIKEGVKSVWGCERRIAWR